MTIISIFLYSLIGCFALTGTVTLCCACPRKKNTSEEILLPTEIFENSFLPTAPFEVFNPDFQYKKICNICGLDIGIDEYIFILQNGGFAHRKCVNFKKV